VKILKSCFTCNKVYKGDFFFLNSSLNQFLDTEINTSTGSKHRVKNKDSLLFTDILRKFVIEKDRVLILAVFFSLYQHFTYGDAREKIHDLLDHGVSRSNNGNRAIVLLFILQLVMIVMLSSR